VARVAGSTPSRLGVVADEITVEIGVELARPAIETAASAPLACIACWRDATRHAHLRKGTPDMTTFEPIAPQPTTPAATQELATTHATTDPGGAEFGRRVVVFLFAILQGLIVLRLVFLLLDAREANGLVSAVLNASQVFVAPFEGLFHTNALQAGGAILDIAAIAALIGWTVVEGIVLSAIGIFRRRSA
jgi:hypothetical protein